MNIIAIVGHSNSGKTRLIQQLISELKSREYSVAVIKRCAHKFTFDQEDKDSWKFMKAGSDAISLISPERLAIFPKRVANLTANHIAKEYFKGIDLILVEGGREDRNLKKIEVLRKGIAEKVECPVEELIAVVSDVDVAVDRPVYHPKQIGEIADFLEIFVEDRKSHVVLDVDGVPVPMNAFVQKIFKNTILAMISSLEGIKDSPEHITLSLIRKERDKK